MKLFLIVFFSGCIITASPAEEILPFQAPLSRYASEWEKSPFNRVVIRVVDTKVISAFAKNFVLEGIVSDDADGLTAYLRDRTDGSFSVITEQATEDQPLHIISHARLDDPRESSIRISNGSKEADISYEKGSMTQKIQEDSPADQDAEKLDTPETLQDRNETPNTNPLASKPEMAPPEGANPESDRRDLENNGKAKAPGGRRTERLPGQ